MFVYHYFPFQGPTTSAVLSFPRADLVSEYLYQDPTAIDAPYYPSTTKPDAIFRHNYAGALGGAIWLDAVHVLLARFAHFNKNKAAQGGAIFSKAGPATVLLFSDSLFAGNEANYTTMLLIRDRVQLENRAATCGLTAGTCQK